MGGGVTRQFLTSSSSIPRCIAVIYICIVSGVFGSPEFDLKDRLLSRYDKHSRPVKNQSNHITIFVDLVLQQITELISTDVAVILYALLTMGGGVTRQFLTSSSSIPRCIAVIYICIVSGVFGSPEFDLKDRLLSRYDKHSRPVKNQSNHITIFVDLVLQQITELDERNQILKTSIWMRWTWEDEYLVWDPANHSSITSLRISPSGIWTPDIAIYNNVKAEEAYWPETYDVSVTSNGSARWLFPFIVETSCRIDISKFPYDTQVCYFKLGSWGHNGYQLDVQNKSSTGDITAFVDNGVWALQRLSVTRNVIYYNCCTEPYPDITFSATLHRRSLFYTINLILPCILFTFINLFTFLLPVESGDKISLNVTILLALDVFLLLVAESMPPQSEVVPDIGIYFITCNGIISVSTVCSVFIIHLYYRGSRGQNVPNWISRYVIFGIGPVLGYSETLGAKPCVKKHRAKVQKCERGVYGKPLRNHNPFAGSQTTSTRKSSLSINTTVTVRSVASLKPVINHAYEPEESRRVRPSSQTSSATSSCQPHYVTPSYHQQCTRSPLDTSNKIDGEDEFKDPVLEWQNVSLVMDRFFFVIVTVATLGLTMFSLSRIS